MVADAPAAPRCAEHCTQRMTSHAHTGSMGEDKMCNKQERESHRETNS